MGDNVATLGVVNNGMMLVDIGNGGESLTIDFTTPAFGELLMVLEDEDIVRHVVYLGLKNILQDSHAGVKQEDFKTDEEWRAAKSERAKKKLDAIYAGDVRMVAASSGTRGDEVKKVAMQIIERHVRADWKKTGTKFKPEDLTAECKKRYAAKTAIWRDLAAAQIKREADELAAILAAAGDDVEEVAESIA